MSVVSGKVFARVYIEREIETVDSIEKVMDDQGSFRAGRRCGNQIFACKHIVENYA